MMEIVFLGVGEAFDSNLPNNSHLLMAKSANMLMDCGYSVPQQWWKLEKDPDFLDAIWISHQHGDHFLGLAPILMRMWEEGRTKLLTIFCEQERSQFFEGLLELVYPGFSAKFKYGINFVGVQAGQKVTFGGLQLEFAPMIHSISVLAIKVSEEAKSYCYSGDGQFTDEAVALYKGSDLVIQETYLYDEKRIGHASIVDAMKMAEQNDVKALAMTHLNRDFRAKELLKLMGKLRSNTVNVFVPQPMDEFNFTT